METKDCLRYDAVQDRYQHLEAGKPGKYDGLSEHLASLVRQASKAKRDAQPLKAGLNHVAGWTQFQPGHMRGE